MKYNRVEFENEITKIGRIPSQSRSCPKGRGSLKTIVSAGVCQFTILIMNTKQHLVCHTHTAGMRRIREKNLQKEGDNT